MILNHNLPLIRQGVDTSKVTVTPEVLAKGVTAHDKDGNLIVGTWVQMYLYGHEADKTVTYNGVELPELPEWDKETYPYAVLCKPSDTYYLMFTKCEFVYGEINGTGAIRNPQSESTKVYRYYYLEGTGWVDDGTITFATNVGMANGLWSNYDVLNADSNVYLAASDPVTTYTNADVSIDGVGYVGAILPKLPNTITEYPNAVICGLTGAYRLFVGNGETLPYYEGAFIKFPKGGISYSYASDTIGNDYVGEVWVEENNYSTDTDGWSGMCTGALVWSNFDLLTTDGEVMMAKSEAVPVYK